MAGFEHFLGMRATNNFTVEGQREQSWREGILRLYPNGDAPLTAITNMMSSSKVSDPQYHWYSQELPEQAAAVTGIYTNNSLTAAVAAALNVGDTIFVKMSARDGRNFVKNHMVLFRNEFDVAYDVVGLVTAPVVFAGDGTYVTVQ
ncbi:MAG: hypothetical protein RR600_06925, partial [Aurantimicrobium sp.]|uniref:hypothetical protein n=1 Tax=Aurantimicrobium sp. TaxID=1930784 RepID=UPI00321FE9B3